MCKTYTFCATSIEINCFFYFKNNSGLLIYPPRLLCMLIYDFIYNLCFGKFEGSRKEELGNRKNYS